MGCLSLSKMDLPKIMTKIYNRRKLQIFRSELRCRMTKGEVVLWKFIKGDQLGYRFRRQYGIGNYIVDFYCPKLKLAVEVDGFTHSECEVFEKDKRKEKFITSIGIMLIRYNDDQILNHLDDVLTDIEVSCKDRDKFIASSATPPTHSW